MLFGACMSQRDVSNQCTRCPPAVSNALLTSLTCPLQVMISTAGLANRWTPAHAAAAVAARACMCRQTIRASGSRPSQGSRTRVRTPWQQQQRRQQTRGGLTACAMPPWGMRLIHRIRWVAGNTQVFLRTMRLAVGDVGAPVRRWTARTPSDIPPGQMYRCRLAPLPHTG